MNSNTTLSSVHGLWPQDGLLVLTSLMMSLVKYTKSSTSQKIWEIPGNISKVMSSTLHGELLHSLELSVARMLNQEFSLHMTQISKVTKKQERGGSRVFICTTQTTSSRHKTMLSTLVTALS